MNNQKYKANRKTSLLLILFGALILCRALPAQRPGMRIPPDMPRNPSTATPSTANPLAANPLQNNSYTLKFHVDDAGITMDISNCPLQKVLEDLAARTGVIFEVRTQDNYLVSLHIKTPINLTTAIKRIASQSNTVFIYSEDESSPQSIKLVKIFPAGTGLPQPSVLYFGTGTITKDNDAIENSEQAIATLLEGKEIGLRGKAIAFLVSEKYVQAGETLLKCISDPAPEIRIAVVEGLAALNVREALPKIIETLKDKDAGVRHSAAIAVSLLGNYSNIKDLRPLRSDKDLSVVAAAENAIRKLSETKVR